MKKNKFLLIAKTGLYCLLILLILFFAGKQIFPRRITVAKTDQGTFQLLVKNKPYLIKGVVYSPIPIGQNHQYDFWADINQPWMEDGRLMAGMGVNTVRFFQPAAETCLTRKVISQLYQFYGIRTILGHWMDYWNPGDYADKQYRRDLTRRVLQMVQAYKNEEGLLMWVLGNENNLSWHTGARVSWSCPQAEEVTDPCEREKVLARIYYSLVNEIARKIKEIDPIHPVALGNADVYALETAAEVCPDIDVIALTSYRGKNFGNLWREAKRRISKPVLIMEFGCDSFHARNNVEDQEIQAAFLTSQWEDIVNNVCGNTGEGNALGGCIFEWNDEWWKHDEHQTASWSIHNTEGDWSGGGYYFDIAAASNMNMNEEWWGLVSLSPELDKGINKRIPKKAYYQLQELWK